MAEMYNTGVRVFTGAGIDWESASKDYRMLLLKSSGPPTFVATHATITDVLAHADNTECDDGSYARVAIPDTDRSIVNDGRATQAHIDAPVDFDTITGETVGAAVLYEHVGADGVNIPIAFLTSPDFPIATNGAGFTIDQGADGLFEAEGVSP